MKQRYKQFVNVNKMVNEESKKEDFEIVRRDVWVQAWCMVASAFNIKEPSSADRWADKCLESFDKRFKI